MFDSCSKYDMTTIAVVIAYLLYNNLSKEEFLALTSFVLRLYKMMDLLM